MDEIMTVLKALTSAGESLRTLQIKAKDAVLQAEGVSIKAQQALAGLKGKQDELTLREKAVADKEARLLSAEAISASLDALEATKLAVETARKKGEQDLKRRVSELDQKEADVLAREKDLLKREKELTAEKEAYKARLLEDIKKKMGLK
jgi:hypothetical protein